MAVYAFVASPLLGPATWHPVADIVGDTVVVPSPNLPPRSGLEFAEHVIAHVPDGCTLVVHSNAGAIAPLVAEARKLRSLVFVDSILPPAMGQQPLTSTDFLNFLEGLAVDGVLPPWTQWWDDLEGLFPDEATRAKVEAEQQRLPLEYFRSQVPAPAGWDGLPRTYLAFGDTYAAERADATVRGWRVTTLEGAHLHQLVDPKGVARVIAESATS
jgi:hypothetical protein